MKGKVIVIDNLVDATRNMVVKNKYILAHTTDISFKRFNPNQPFPRNNNNNRADAQNNNQNANANVAANDNMNLRPNDFGSPQHAMSQIITVRDNPNFTVIHLISTDESFLVTLLLRFFSMWQLMQC